MATVLDRWERAHYISPGSVNLVEFAPRRYRAFDADAFDVGRLLNRYCYVNAGKPAVDINDAPEGWEDILSRAGLNIVKHAMEEATV